MRSPWLLSSGLDPGEPLFRGPQDVGQARRTQAFPIAEVVILQEFDRGIEVNDQALGPALRGEKRCTALASQRGDLQKPGLEIAG